MSTPGCENRVDMVVTANVVSFMVAEFAHFENNAFTGEIPPAFEDAVGLRECSFSVLFLC